MTHPAAVHAAFAVFAVAAIVSGYRVFRTDSMVRAAFLLLASFANVAAILLLLAAEYLGWALLFMMAIEMVVMAVFMVMFMMNPAGLNPMAMVHQETTARVAGVALFAAVAAVAVAGGFPERPVGEAGDRLAALGTEIMGGSMLVMQGAAATLLAAMIGAVALTSSRGRFGDDDGALPPPREPGGDALADERARAGTDGDAGGGHEHHHGHGGHG